MKNPIYLRVFYLLKNLYLVAREEMFVISSISMIITRRKWKKIQYVPTSWLYRARLDML